MNKKIKLSAMALSLGMAFASFNSQAATVVIGVDSSTADDGTATTNGSSDGIAIGTGATVGAGGVVVGGGIAIGVGASATNWATTAVGSGAGASGPGATAIGEGTVASSQQSTAVGAGAIASGQYSQAFGDGAQATNAYAISLGQESHAAGIHSIATGSMSRATSYDSIAIGHEAYSGEIESISLGKSSGAVGISSISIGADSAANSDASVAIGARSYTNNANDVALGADSVTKAVTPTANSTIAGTVYNYAGATPTSSVSFGSVRAERQLQNVAAGQLTATSTDAVNGSQLFATNAAIDKLAVEVGRGGGGSGDVGDGNVVFYDGSTQDTVTLTSPTSTDGGVTGGTTITNVHQGALNATSTDAVNGSQLYTTNQTIAALDAGTVHYATNADGSVNYNSVVFAGTTSTDGGVTGGTTISNIHQGAISATSTDAINGTQLFTIGNSIASIIGGNTTYNPVTNTYTTSNIGGTGANTVDEAIAAVNTKANDAAAAAVTAKSTVSAGSNVVVTASTNANGSTNYEVATAKNVIFDSTTVGTVVTNVTNVDATGNTIITGVGAGAVTATSTDAVNGAQLYAITQAVTGSNGVKYDTATKDVVTLEGPTSTDGGVTGGTTITNVHQGALTATSTDAVNGSQLYAVSQTANAGWNIATDSGAAAASNVKPSDTVNFNGDGNVVVSNVGNDVTVGLADKVTIGKGGTAVTIDGTNGTIQAGGVTINGDKGTVNGLSNTTWDANNIVSGQAATEDQLKVVADSVTAAVGVAKTEVEAGKNVFVSSKPGDKGQTVYTVATKDEVDFNKVTVGGLTIDKSNVDAAGNTIISGVGAGELSSTSTDVVSGSQLYATNQQVAKNTTDITNINTTLDKGLSFSADSGSTVNRKLGDTVAITGDGNITTTTTANGVQLKLSDNIDVKNVKVSESITVAEGAKVDMGGNVIQNVAPGVNGTDAANVNQVNAVAGNLNNRISNVGHIANAGVAQAIATAGLPQAYLPGKSMMAVAGGTYEGEAGYAIGFSTISDNGKWIIKVTGSGNSRDKYGASLGAGYQW